MPYNCIRRHSSSSHIENARREDARGAARRFASWRKPASDGQFFLAPIRMNAILMGLSLLFRQACRVPF
jgi:hypothetical protein